MNAANFRPRVRDYGSVNYFLGLSSTLTIINTDIYYQACACMLVIDCSNIFKYDIDVVGDHSTYKLGNFYTF